MMETSVYITKRLKRKRTKQFEFRTHYDILGASPSDTHKELRARYVHLARQLHPDSNRGSSINVASFTEVTEAWKVLSDPKTRRRYDRYLQMTATLDVVGKILAVGVEMAIPIVKQTAVTTMRVFENSYQAMYAMRKNVHYSLESRELQQK